MSLRAAGLEVTRILAGERATENSKYIKDGNTAWIPKGFTVSGISTEQSIENGLVIYDIPEGTTVDWSNPDSVKTKYNQFVWIPTTVFEVSTDYNGSIYKDLNGNCDEETGIADQIEELKESIYKYGGFYIGRYEAGTSTPRTSSSSQTEEFVVQQDKYPYETKWGETISDVSEGPVYLCNNLYSSTNTNYGATSMLCTGTSWDSMLDFIKDSTHSLTNALAWGNYSKSEAYKVYRGSLYSNSTWSVADTTNGSEVTKGKSILLTTGATERNSSKNIYDVAGNLDEWTTASNGHSCRAVRGRC